MSTSAEIRGQYDGSHNVGMTNPSSFATWQEKERYVTAYNNAKKQR